MRNHAEGIFIEPGLRHGPLEPRYAGGADLPLFLPEPVQEPLRPIPVCGAPLQFEVLFCLTGRLAVRPLQGTSYTVEAPAIFLLSDSSALRSCQYSENLGGILIAVDAKAAKESLVTVCSTLGDEVGHQDRQAEDDGEERLHGPVRHTLDAVIF